MPGDPQHVEPLPVESPPVEPAPVEPLPVEPLPVESLPVAASPGALPPVESLPVVPPPVAPLTSEEEAAWRALGRAALIIPRLLDADLRVAEGLNVTEYNVLMNLSEAPGRALRMTELANYVSITVSGLTRVIERLSRDGLVERVRSDTDGRGQLAVLTDAGFRRLQQVWPTHLASVRRHVMDHLRGIDLTTFAEALAEIANAEMGPPVRRSPPR
jgi:DNA-binding MarR family transcriptional regulator